MKSDLTNSKNTPASRKTLLSLHRRYSIVGWLLILFTAPTSCSISPASTTVNPTVNSYALFGHKIPAQKNDVNSFDIRTLNKAVPEELRGYLELVSNKKIQKDLLVENEYKARTFENYKVVTDNIAQIEEKVISKFDDMIKTADKMLDRLDVTGQFHDIDSVVIPEDNEYSMFIYNNHFLLNKPFEFFMAYCHFLASHLYKIHKESGNLDENILAFTFYNEIADLFSEGHKYGWDIKVLDTLRIFNSRIQESLASLKLFYKEFFEGLYGKASATKAKTTFNAREKASEAGFRDDMEAEARRFCNRESGRIVVKEYDSSQFYIDPVKEIMPHQKYGFDDYMVDLTTELDAEIGKGSSSFSNLVRNMKDVKVLRINSNWDGDLKAVLKIEIEGIPYVLKRITSRVNAFNNNDYIFKGLDPNYIQEIYKIYHVIDPNNKDDYSVFILSEYFDFRVTEESLKELDEEGRKDFIRQTVEGVKYLNTRANIRHNDLHIDNIMGKYVFENGEWRIKYKLIDLGIATPLMMGEGDPTFTDDERERQISSAIYNDMGILRQYVYSNFRSIGDRVFEKFYDDIITILCDNGGTKSK